MKIALIGYGAMGRLIHVFAENKGHEVVVAFDEPDRDISADEMAAKMAGAEVAIDFSNAAAVKRNVTACVKAGVALVEGTTGWSEQKAEIEKIVLDGNGAFLFGANFSIGVNLFYRIAAYSAELFAKFPQFEAFLEEQHHSRKLDAPSGTALKIKDIVAEHIKKDFSITATRAGNIPGTHRVGFDGPADQILLEHTARSREGFAFGAITAAEWISGKCGVYEFTAVIDELYS
jgi:4-hydroxy-tetrahydrodipicolinate reductase